MEARTGTGGILVYPDRGVTYGNEDIFEKGYRGSGTDFEGRRTGGFSDGDGLRPRGKRTR